ncbi:MAG TPA: DUF177 domain-containing protein [Nitrospiria bacterium]|nr:DUF177 domain-containing protein [Nitrospiria bacterium]
MKIHRSDIPNEGFDLDCQADPSTLALNDSGVEFADSIHIRARLVLMDHAVHVSGEAKACAKLQCVRCLEALSYPVRSSFEITLVPKESKTDRPSGEWHELQEKELDEYFYSDDTIDLTDLVREQVLLSLPTYPLCRPHCRGLCPQCGLDLNRGSCRCAVEDLHRPMTPLQEKLKKIIKK